MSDQQKLFEDIYGLNVGALMDELRSWGWSVAVHNDYRQGGDPHTFWLFTGPGKRCAKGEGRTDAEALAQVRAAVVADAAMGPSRSLTAPQAMPTGDGVPILELVLADLREKSAAGTKKYGTPLKTENGRDALVDAYQEALDLPMYLRQEIEQRRRSSDSLGDALLLQASELREVMEAAKAEERARCVAIARAEEALWREEGAKPVEQRNMLASTQAVMAAEATAGRIAAAVEVETKSKETPAAYVALRSAQEVSGGDPVPAGAKKIGTVEREEHFAVPIEQVRQALAMVCDGAEYGSGWRHILDMAISELAKLRAKASPEPFGSVPVNVEMWCPFCGLQHVESGEWVTRVHHTHLCSGCRKKWRVAPAVFGVDAHRELIIGGAFPPALRGLVDLEHRQNAVVVNNQRRRTFEAEAKLDVASSRAAEAVMRFSGVEEQVRFEVAAAVRQAVNGALDATHQSALAKLQHDVQKADQRADKSATRVAELEALLEKERRPVRCSLCEQDIAPGTMVSATTDGRVVHSTCPKSNPPPSGAV